MEALLLRGGAPSDATPQLTTVPVDGLQRALQHDLDSGNPLFLSENDSTIAIGQAIRTAMEDREITAYILHEKTGLPIDIVQDFIDGRGDLSASEPLQKIEAALQVRLSHL
jgi:hypothetical protein